MRLVARFHEHKDLVNKHFTGSGAAAPFAIQIDFGFLLGLYGEEIRKDLHFIRKIRNEFAHQASAVDFEAQKISGLLENVQIIDRLKQDNGWLHGGKTPYEAFVVGGPRPVPINSRGRFLTSVQLLLAVISMAATENRPPTPEF